MTKILKNFYKIPGDKSISHRALILGALAKGTTEIRNISFGKDVLSTIACLRHLGISIEITDYSVFVHGNGLYGFRESVHPLNCGNSGTTMRLLAGLLCSQNFRSILTGDESLSKRPMQRIKDPLSKMGARINLNNNNFAPIVINPAKIHPIDFFLTIPSAQVKSAIMLAALYSSKETRIFGSIQSRDHSERLFKLFNAKIRTDNSQILIQGGVELDSCIIDTPGDPSSAAFLIVAACLIPNAKVKLNKISLNKTRIGFVDILKKMGANIDIEITTKDPEPIGTITARYSILHGIQIDMNDTQNAIDEIPILSIAFTQAVGISTIQGAQELRIKESDRLRAIVYNLKKMGINLFKLNDGFKILGPQRLFGAKIKTFNDHRIAMTFKVAGLLTEKNTEIDNEECIKISDPNFLENLNMLKYRFLNKQN